MTATAVEFTRRDYSLVGRDTKAAEENGLAAAEWYHCPISRKELKELMQRSDQPAITHTIIWFASFLVTGFFGWYFWGTIWCVPFFIAYGVLYGGSSDSRWHECGHGTAFKTRWMNDVVYNIASFMVLREPTVWRWSHARHHTDTIIVGRDPEIAVMRPADVIAIFLNFFQLKSGYYFFKGLFIHAAGRLKPDEATYIPEMERQKVYNTARIFLAIYAAVIVACIWTGSILPAMYIGLPSFYGAWLMVFFGLTQHAGLAEDVLDHRLNSRTVYMNPVFRFLYLNMNYHVEHHMFPMVPYHALPKLHEKIKNDCPTPYSSCWAAYKEIIPTVWRQVKDPTYFVRRQLPPGAKSVPYNHGTRIVPAE
ncbi:MAG: fatty acid desaturase family protein [Rhizobiales bacterium]|nr:fatty acid desaturase family protein [Hyphomicrobiales bacterium]